MKILVAIGGFVVLAFVVIMFLFSYNNMGNGYERQLEAVQDNAENIIAQYQLLVVEAAQVPEMQRDDLKEVVTAALEGRYGENGSRAIFQAISEDNPQIDSTVYVKLQTIMQSGRNDFQREQTRQLDIIREYKTKLGNMPSGFFLGVMGYPKLDLNDFEIVSTERANELMETKIEEPIKLR